MNQHPYNPLRNIHCTSEGFLYVATVLGAGAGSLTYRVVNQAAISEQDHLNGQIATLEGKISTVQTDENSFLGVKEALQKQHIPVPADLTSHTRDDANQIAGFQTQISTLRKEMPHPNPTLNEYIGGGIIVGATLVFAGMWRAAKRRYA